MSEKETATETTDHCSVELRELLINEQCNHLHFVCALRESVCHMSTSLLACVMWVTAAIMTHEAAMYGIGPMQNWFCGATIACAAYYSICLLGRRDKAVRENPSEETGKRSWWRWGTGHLF